jgi:hypothetical protein
MNPARPYSCELAAITKPPWLMNAFWLSMLRTDETAIRMVKPYWPPLLASRVNFLVWTRRPLAPLLLLKCLWSGIQRILLLILPLQHVHDLAVSAVVLLPFARNVYSRAVYSDLNVVGKLTPVLYCSISWTCRRDCFAHLSGRSGSRLVQALLWPTNFVHFTIYSGFIFSTPVCDWGQSTMWRRVVRSSTFCTNSILMVFATLVRFRTSENSDEWGRALNVMNAVRKR